MTDTLEEMRGRARELINSVGGPEALRENQLYGTPLRTEADKEKIKKELLLDDVFGKEKKPFKSVGMGVHNGVFYYGTSVEIDGKPTTAIITSDKQYYVGEDIKTKFGLNFREDFDEQAIDFVWSNAAIHAFLKGEEGIVKARDVYERIVALFDKYMEFLTPTTSKYLACAVMSDYCYWLFDHKGRILITAEKGSGKTKLSKIYWLLGFNTMWISNTSEANLFRSIEATAGTPIVDNEDNLGEEARKALAQQFQTGFGHESLYRRVEGEAKKRTRKFVNYSPMLKNNILGVDEVSLDRAHEIKLLKTKSEKGKLQPKDKDPIFEKSRDDLRVLMMKGWGEIQALAEKFEPDGLENREIDVEKPALTIAKWLGDDVYSSVLAYVQEHWKARKGNRDFTTDWNFMLTESIYQRLGEDTQMWMSYADLTTDMMARIYGSLDPERDRNYQEKRSYVNRYIAKELRRVSLFASLETRLIHGMTEKNVTAEAVVRWIKTKEYPIEIRPEHSSTISTNSTLSTLSPFSTKTDSKQVEIVEKVEKGESEGALGEAKT